MVNEMNAPVEGLNDGGASAANPAPQNAPEPEDGAVVGEVDEVLGELGLSAEEFVPEEKDRIGKVVQYMHNKRGEDALRYRELEERANRLETLLDDPRIRVALSSSMPMPPTTTPKAEEEPLISAEELQMIATDPNRFVSGLTKRFNEQLDKRLAAFRESTVAPLETQSKVQAEVNMMDGVYPEWRAKVEDVRQTMRKDPTLTTVRSAYERGVYIPKLLDENKRLKSQLAAYQRKAPVEGASSLAANAANAGTPGTPKVFNTTMDAILDAVERANKLKPGARA